MNIIIKSTVVDAAKNKLISAKTKNFLKQNHITLPNEVSAKRQKKSLSQENSEYVCPEICDFQSNLSYPSL